MTKLIKDKFNTIIDSITSKKEASQHMEPSKNTSIVRSNSSKHDEYGYFNRMENL